MSVVAVDYGLKRSGLAVACTGSTCALPEDTVESPELIQRIQSLHIEDPIEYIVMGMPLSLRPHENSMTEAVRAVARDLESLGFSVHFVDERHSTNKAMASLSGLGLKRGKIKQSKDEMAAVLILQDFLEYHLPRLAQAKNPHSRPDFSS